MTWMHLRAVELFLAMGWPQGQVYFWLFSFLVCSLSLFLSLVLFGTAWAILTSVFYLIIYLLVLYLTTGEFRCCCFLRLVTPVGVCYNSPVIILVKESPPLGAVVCP